MCHWCTWNLTLGRTLKFKPEPPHRATRGGGFGWMEPPPRRVFQNVAVCRDDFTFSGKPLIFSTRWGISWGCGATGGLWRHQQWSPSWILPRIRNQVEAARNGDCFVLDMKNNTYINTLDDFSHKIYFYYSKKLEKHHLYLHIKMAWPPATYDVIFRNPRNWPLLNLTQNVPEGWTNSY